MRVTVLTLTVLCLADVRASGDDHLFATRIAPILEAHCVGCHNASSTKGGLSLATSKTALAGGEGGVSIVPGKPDESFLLDYISGDEPLMPKDGPALKAAEVEAVRAWIAGGAKWPEGITLVDKKIIDADWWSLRPLLGATPPELNSPWVRTPVDAFVLGKLQANNLSPVPEADRRSLIRRLTFNLHGLPPTPEEIDAFVGDPAPDAYEKLVDRLLASPRYGERWARHWLDVMHFGETHGYDKDKPRPNAWPYRDYVIRSLNEDKPYGRFVEEQLAGDVLYPDDPQATVATGFISAGPWDFVGHVELREGTTDKLIARSNDRDDMVATAASTFLSLTVHCARCHNHKFDPIKQDEYYALQAVFAGVERGDRTYDADPAIAETRRRLIDEKQQLTEQQQLIDKQIAERTGPQLTEVDASIKDFEQQLAALQPEKSSSPTLGYHSHISSKQDVTKWVQLDLGEVVSIDQISLVPAHVVYGGHKGPGFGFPHRYKVEVSTTEDFAEPILVADHTAADVPNPGDQFVEITLDKVNARYIRVTATRLRERTADWIFALSEIAVQSDSKNIARGAKVTSHDSIEAAPAWAMDNIVDGYSSRELLYADVTTAERKRTELKDTIAHATKQREQLIDSLLDDATRKLRLSIAKRLTQVTSDLDALPRQSLVYASVPREPREVHVLDRGDVRAPRHVAAPAGLSAVHGPPAKFEIADSASEGARRASFARWLSDPRNVLVRRSIVNRVWHYHFGQGIVDTPNDFGRMGSEPSHPELLDWLAGWFIENGESLKKLHRLLVTSSVYRQSSQNRPDFAKIDSSNRLLWRMNRQRLDAESLRDSMLAVSGQLDLTMGGPSVQQFFFKDDHSPIYDYEHFDVDDARSNRRSIYRFLVRSVPDPLMDCLDCADPSILTPKRETTVTALQALALYNNRFAVRQAEHLAARVQKQHNRPCEQLELVYRLSVGRSPTTAEQTLLLDHLNKFGLASTCRLVLNSNEFVFVD